MYKLTAICPPDKIQGIVTLLRDQQLPQYPSDIDRRPKGFRTAQAWSIFDYEGKLVRVINTYRCKRKCTVKVYHLVK